MVGRTERIALIENFRKTIVSSLSAVLGISQIFRQNVLFLNDFQKLFIVGAGHTDVHVVVPRNKPFMTDGTQQSSCRQGITQPVFFATDPAMNPAFP